MAFDAFMKIDSIPGECGDTGHAKWIELESLHWSLANETDFGAQPTGGHRYITSPLTFCKSVDAATPLLVKACAEAQVLPEVRIEICRATKDKQKYMEYKLKKAVVKRITNEATTGGDLPIDRVEMVMDELTIEYTQTDLKTGRALGGSLFQMDFVKQK